MSERGLIVQLAGGVGVVSEGRGCGRGVVGVVKIDEGAPKYVQRCVNS